MFNYGKYLAGSKMNMGLLGSVVSVTVRRRCKCVYRCVSFTCHARLLHTEVTFLCLSFLTGMGAVLFVES
jgi:hypothetical protein